MISTYQAASNTATGGAVIGAANTAIEIFKIIVGLPVSSGNIWLFNITNPGGSTNTNLITKLTQGASIATSQVPVTYDLTSPNGKGIVVNNGANLMIDQTMQVTVLWDYAQSAEGSE